MHTQIACTFTALELLKFKVYYLTELLFKHRSKYFFHMLTCESKSTVRILKLTCLSALLISPGSAAVCG